MCSALLQVGRAGRDGSEARCLTFLDDADFVRLRSLTASNSAPVAAIRSLLDRVLAEPMQEEPQQQPVADGEHPGAPGPLFGLLPLAETSSELDLREEVMETLLSYLQGDHCPHLLVLPQAPTAVEVYFHRSPPEVRPR